jgi:Holliday junction DNA helicase RuvA
VIASLRGIIKAIRDDALILDVGGVGYLVRVSHNLLSEIGHVGQPLELYTHTHIRENELGLYGFRTLEELDLFHLLLGVSGIGPRTALAVLSAFSPVTLRSALAQGDALALSRVPGIGRKMAQRLALELKDKIGITESAALARLLSSADADVLNALTALGYSLSEAQEGLAAVPENMQDLDQRILAALRSLGSR